VVAVLLQLSSSPQFSSLVSVNDELADASETPTTPRLRRNAKKLIVTRWNCARRGWEAGTQRSLLLKARMRWGAGVEVTFRQEQKPAMYLLFPSSQAMLL
jgi:hypothetical protein